MVSTLLLLFLILSVTIPFLYRYVRAGRMSLLFHKDGFGEDSNYAKAENIRVLQVLMGYGFFIFHGSHFWGLNNAVLFFALGFIISLSGEIVGSKTGIVFGGKYTYEPKYTSGPMIAGVPVLIPIAWTGIIYMSLNFSTLVTAKDFPENMSIAVIKLIVLASVFTMLLDLILDPIAVDEKRWQWNVPGVYYGVPILNFVSWFGNSLIILAVFVKFHFPVMKSPESFLLMKYSPGLLFVLLPAIAARPCFERKLTIPGFLGITATLVFFLLMYLIK